MKIVIYALAAAIGLAAAAGSAQLFPKFTEDGEYYGEPVESVTLPDDSPFCADDQGNIGPKELAAGPNCMLQGDTPEVFAEKPIASFGLDKGQIALTIDDGPNPNVTLPLLDLFDQYGIKVTFFMVGKQVAAHPEVVREVARRGHTIGNHSYDHNIPHITAATILDEVMGADRELRKALGGRIPNRLLFRAPGLGWSTQKALNMNANSAGRKYIGPIHANMGTDAPVADWYCWGHGISAAACADSYFKQIVRTGRGVILSHDIFYKAGRANSYQMWKILLARLDKEAGGIKRNGTGPGVWQFVKLQDVRALDKYEVEGTNIPGARSPVEVMKEDPNAPPPAPAPGTTEEKTSEGLTVISQFKTGNMNVRSQDLASQNPALPLDVTTLIGTPGNNSRALKTADVQSAADTGERIQRGGVNYAKLKILKTSPELSSLVGASVYVSVNAL